MMTESGSFTLFDILILSPAGDTDNFAFKEHWLTGSPTPEYQLSPNSPSLWVRCLPHFRQVQEERGWPHFKGNYPSNILQSRQG
jgi:hypothetical protein